MRYVLSITFVIGFTVVSFANPIYSIVCFQFQTEYNAQLQRDAEGWITLPTGISELDKMMIEYGIEKLEPQFTFDPISLSNPTFFELGMDKFYLIRLPNPIDEKVSNQLLQRLNHSSFIETAWFAELHTIFLTPNDWGLSGRDMWYLDAINARQAWDIQLGSPNILAVTIDTGVDFYHPDLVQNIAINSGEDINRNGQFDQGDLNGIDNDGNGFIDDVVGYDFVSFNLQPGMYPAVGEDYGPRDPIPFDVQGHGTHVAGIIAARTNNGIGVPSASFNVKTLAVRAGFAWLDEQGATTAYGNGADIDFISAIQYSVNRGARIISISFGGPDTNPSYQTAINYARNNNCLVFAAAGNENVNTSVYPAAYTGVVAVAALDRGYVKASFSNYGNWVDLCAPGVNVWSTMVVNTYNRNPYVAMSGTSAACPLAAAVGALVLSRFPSYTDDQLETRLRSTAMNINAQNPFYVGQLGAGCVDAAAAVGTTIQLLNESFEGTWPPTGWLLRPPYGNGVWVRSNGNPYGPGYAAHGSYCAMFNAYDYPVNVTGHLITPTLNFQNVGSLQLTFNWYNYDEVGYDAELYVSITTNGGTTWNVLGQFIAVSHNWQTATIPLLNYQGRSSVSISFSVTSDYGYYNIFVDNVRITGVMNAEETIQSQIPNGFELFELYPNPFNSSATVSFQLPRTSDVTFAVYDLLGRQVYFAEEKRLSVGLHSRTLTLADKPSGTYFLQLRAGDQSFVRKIVLMK